MTVQELEAAVTQLSTQELAEFATWLENYHAQLWDQQLEEDLETGRLDKFLAEANEEYKTGPAQPL